jgi:hypothetical protein
MLVPLGDLFHQIPPLLCDALAARLQILLEPLKRREGNFDGAEGEVHAAERV